MRRRLRTPETDKPASCATSSRVIPSTRCMTAMVCVLAVYERGHYTDEIIGGLLLGWSVAALSRAIAGPVRPAAAR